MNIEVLIYFIFFASLIGLLVFLPQKNGLRKKEKRLVELAEELAGTLNLGEAVKTLSAAFLEIFGAQKTSVFLKRGKEGKFYEARALFEKEGEPLLCDERLIDHLQKEKKPLIRRELLSQKVEKSMKKRGAEVCFPLFYKKELTGVLFLGEKTKKKYYTKEEIKILEKELGRISCFLYNALLFSELYSFNQSLENKLKGQAKELKKTYKKLQRIEKAKTEFMSIVSHQLRTPLSIIKGHLSMLQEGMYDNDAQKKEKVLENISQSTNRLIALVNDVLNISRIQSGKLELNKEKVDLVEIIEEVVEKIRPAAEEKEIGLFLDKPEREKIPAEIDVSKVENAVGNLLDNAIKYTSEGEVRVVLKEEEGFFVIEVQDTGEGMTKEEIDKLFDTFCRGSAGRRHWAQGSGLGLYIARQFVRMQGGEISADSEGEGRGSVFRLKIPF